MAWACSSSTNAGLIDNLAANEILSTPRIIDAFKQVDRAHFVPDTGGAYEDSPQYIGNGATISAPHMHAHATETLSSSLLPGAKVLDVGCGSGYLLAVFHHLVSPPSSSASTSEKQGHVLGIEHIPTLSRLSTTNLQKNPLTASALLSPSLPPSSPTAHALNSPSKPSIQVLTADGRLGSPDDATPESGWDVIHVGAAAPTMPEKLVEQLALGGKMFVPVGPDGGDQSVWLVEKALDGEVKKDRLFGVRYVPLTEREKQESASW
ncbi:protein-L-isoaspartate (D-aspartate) O-methyltransferase [Pseudohyphozyma bogoriensis]|nr:protein-L-isoaspartate (D-aspartate) O-methyltransferase [Pseudohyphozyma bogoriensis]